MNNIETGILVLFALICAWAIITQIRITLIEKRILQLERQCDHK